MSYVPILVALAWYSLIFLWFFRCSEKAMEQKEMAEQELLMKGPGTFPLERLLAIFQCITYGEDSSVDEEVRNEDDPLGSEVAQNDLTSNVLLQVSSLCNANFISKGGSCPLEGSTRYKSTVSEELALKVTSNGIQQVFFHLTCMLSTFVSHFLKLLTGCEEPQVSPFKILV